MPVLVIRHGLSQANNRENIGSLAFASMEAPLMEQGREQAAELKRRLAVEHGIDTLQTPAATSELLRTQETARFAGFTALTAYASLNEVVHGLELMKLRQMLDERKLPEAAIEAASAILENPPTERVWFTHGLVIASLCQILGIAKDARFIPKFCEIRELPIKTS